MQRRLLPVIRRPQPPAPGSTTATARPQVGRALGRATWSHSLLVLCIAACVLAAAAAPLSDRRQELLAELLRHTARSAPWEEWLRRSGELPPDFDTLPGVASLPDPLRRPNGPAIKTKNQWHGRRNELLQLFQHYVFGKVPPPPGNVRVGAEEVREEPGAMLRQLTLEFGPGHRARLHVELLVPKGKGPFPVFITQDNHRRWALVALSRGYLGCVYAGADSRDDTGDWVALWPDFDWTKLARRAWAASRCIDYLLTRPEVDRTRIALAGHSRNGKLALIAAALDERISAVISSSSGAGGACSYRLFSETQFGEGIEMITRAFPDWLHPRLRFFVGRENRLPIDQHELVACVAPRACLLSTALNDSVESVWAIDQTFYAARPVYQLLGATDALNLRFREGPHATKAEDIESYVDWLDAKFGRRRGVVSDGPFYPTYADWQAASGERIDPQQFPPRGLDDLLRASNGGPITSPAPWEAKRAEIRQRVAWALGEPPPVGQSVPGDYGAEGRPTATLLGRAGVPAGLVKQSLNFGNYCAGDLYYPTHAAEGDRKLPALIWVHPLSNPGGYVAGYYRGEQPYALLARTGYAIFAFDQIGNGARISEVRDFYRRYPRWSLLGKTVQDIRAAVDALERHPRVDAKQIFLLGYATGGMAALHAAALDERIAGVVSVAGFTPMRLDTPDKGTGGVARWSRWLPWLPRLGAFVGYEARIPYDYHEVLALVAPRPVLVITPRIDYQSTYDDLKLCVEQARRVYTLLGAPQGLVFQRANDYNHFSPDLIFCLCGEETIR